MTARDINDGQSNHRKEYENDRNEDRVNLALMGNDLRYIKEKVTEVAENVNRNYVTKEEFGPVKSLVYGLVGIVLTSVVVAIVALVVVRA